MNKKGDGKWSWRTDQGTWVAYADDMNEKLDDAMHAGINDVKVDSQRFIDLGAMCQRRYDDPGAADSTTIEEITKKVDAGEGLVSKYICPTVTHIVALGDDELPTAAELAEANELKLPIVTHEFLEALQSKRMKDVNVDHYKVSVPASLLADAAKVASGPGAKQASTAAPVPNVVIAATVAPTVVAPSVQPFDDGIAAGAKWVGFQARKEDEDETDTVEFVVIEVNKHTGKFIGEIKIPTQKNLKVKVVGQADGDKVELDQPEISALLGKDKGCWKGTAQKKSMKLETSDLTMELSYTETVAAAAKPFSWIQKGAKYTGKCTQEFSFDASITKMDTKNGEFEGTFLWPSLENTKTAIKGKLIDDAITIDEMEVIEGDGVEVPMHYSGKVVAVDHDPKRRKIEGTYSGDQTLPLGSFSIPL